LGGDGVGDDGTNEMGSSDSIVSLPRDDKMGNSHLVSRGKLRGAAFLDVCFIWEGLLDYSGCGRLAKISFRSNLMHRKTRGREEKDDIPLGRGIGHHEELWGVHASLSWFI
jgi:hypothetical protein